MGKKNGNKGAKKKYATVDTVQKMIDSDIETKYHDYDIVNSPSQILNTGLTFYISDVNDGLTNVERVGQMIKVFRLEIKGTLNMLDPINQPVAFPVRIIIWRDLNESNQRSLITDVIESGDRPTIQQVSWDDRKRFRVLHDKRYLVDPVNHPRSLFDIVIKKPMNMTYNAPGGGSGGYGRVCLGMLADGNLGNSAPTVTFTSRMYFKDA